MELSERIAQAAEIYAPMPGLPDKEHLRSDRLIARMEQAAFRTGARWCMNSLWYGADETPDDDKTILTIDVDGEPLIVAADYLGWRGWEKVRGDFEIAAWAYMDDLMPDRMVLETNKDAFRRIKEKVE